MNSYQRAENKLFCLSVLALGTQYELMIGRTEPYIPTDNIQANYYRGTYFIASLCSKRFTTFRHPVLPSRLVEAKISDDAGCEAIANWINSFSSPDEVINSPQFFFEHTFLSD